MSHFEIFDFFKWCLQINVMMYCNYIKFMQIFGFFFMNKCIIYAIIYYTNEFFFFFSLSNNVRSYDLRFNITIHDPTYLPRSYVESQFLQPYCQHYYYYYCHHSHPLLPNNSTSTSTNTLFFFFFL